MIHTFAQVWAAPAGPAGQPPLGRVPARRPTRVGTSSGVPANRLRDELRRAGQPPPGRVPARRPTGSGTSSGAPADGNWSL
jgi:hypothetical protein